MPAHAVSDDEKLQLFIGDKAVLVCFADRSDVAETARFDHVSDSRWFRQICQPGRLRRSVSAVIRAANATLVVLPRKKGSYPFRTRPSEKGYDPFFRIRPDG